MWKSEGTVEIALAKCEIRRRVVCVREELLRRVDAWEIIYMLEHVVVR